MPCLVDTGGRACTEKKLRATLGAIKWPVPNSVHPFSNNVKWLLGFPKSGPWCAVRVPLLYHHSLRFQDPEAMLAVLLYLCWSGSFVWPTMTLIEFVFVFGQKLGPALKKCEGCLEGNPKTPVFSTFKPPGSFQLTFSRDTQGRYNPWRSQCASSPHHRAWHQQLRQNSWISACNGSQLFARPKNPSWIWSSLKWQGNHLAPRDHGASPRHPWWSIRILSRRCGSPIWNAK